MERRGDDATRHPQQAIVAPRIALGFGALGAFSVSWRRAGVLLAAAAAGCAVWTLQAKVFEIFRLRRYSSSLSRPWRSSRPAQRPPA
jgi:hypothetical protein